MDTIKDYEATIRVITKNEGFGYREQTMGSLPTFDSLVKKFQSVSIWKDQSILSDANKGFDRDYKELSKALAER